MMMATKMAMIVVDGDNNGNDSSDKNDIDDTDGNDENYDSDRHDI